MPVHPSLLGSYSPLSPPWPRASQICVFQTWNTIFSANAAFQFAWFWHYTQSLQLSQDFQRRGYRLPFHKAWDNPLSPRGHSKQGRRHLSDRETLRGNWTEGQNVQHQAADKTCRWHTGREDLLCWLPFWANPSFFPTINLCSSACHILFYLFLHPTFPYSVLSPAAFYSQSAHSHINSPSPVKALHGNGISPAAFTPLFWLLCVTPLSFSCRRSECVWGRDHLEPCSPSPLCNWAPVLANFILALS